MLSLSSMAKALGGFFGSAKKDTVDVPISRSIVGMTSYALLNSLNGELNRSSAIGSIAVRNEPPTDGDGLNALETDTPDGLGIVWRVGKDADAMDSMDGIDEYPEPAVMVLVSSSSGTEKLELLKTEPLGLKTVGRAGSALKGCGAG